MAYAGLTGLTGALESKQNSDTKRSKEKKPPATAVSPANLVVKKASASPSAVDKDLSRKPAAERDVRTTVSSDTSALQRPPVPPQSKTSPLQQLQEANTHFRKKKYAEVLEALKACTQADIEQLPLSQQHEIAYLRLQAMLLTDELPIEGDVTAELARFNNAGQQLLWQKMVNLTELQSKSRRLTKLLNSQTLQGHDTLQGHEECVFLKTFSATQISALVAGFNKLPESNHSWTLYWKGLAGFSQENFTEARECFRKAHHLGMKQSSPWLALCIIACTNREFGQDIETPLSRDEQKKNQE